MRIDISKAYGEKKIFKNLQLHFPEGQVTCLLGASGVGKTTLLNILAGLTDFEGSTEGVPAQVGYIFQEPRLLPNLSVYDNLRYAGANLDEIPQALEDVGLTAYAQRKTSRLSGGEKQRVAIARAFLSHAPLLLLDEPFSSLDTPLKVKLCNVFARLWKKEKPTVVMVTHDVEEALMLGHKVVILKDGKAEKQFALLKSEYPAPYAKACAEREEILKEILCFDEQGEKGEKV